MQRGYFCDCVWKMVFVKFGEGEWWNPLRDSTLLGSPFMMKIVLSELHLKAQNIILDLQKYNDVTITSTRQTWTGEANVIFVFFLKQCLSGCVCVGLFSALIMNGAQLGAWHLLLASPPESLRAYPHFTQACCRHLLNMHLPVSFKKHQLISSEAGDLQICKSTSVLLQREEREKKIPLDYSRRNTSHPDVATEPELPWQMCHLKLAEIQQQWNYT